MARRVVGPRAARVLRSARTGAFRRWLATAATGAGTGHNTAGRAPPPRRGAGRVDRRRAVAPRARHSVRDVLSRVGVGVERVAHVVTAHTREHVAHRCRRVHHPHAPRSQRIPLYRGSLGCTIQPPYRAVVGTRPFRELKVSTPGDPRSPRGTHSSAVSAAYVRDQALLRDCCPACAAKSSISGDDEHEEREVCSDRGHTHGVRRG
jgi:hypothetical protein